MWFLLFIFCVKSMGQTQDEMASITLSPVQIEMMNNNSANLNEIKSQINDGNVSNTNFDDLANDNTTQQLQIRYRQRFVAKFLINIFLFHKKSLLYINYII